MISFTAINKYLSCPYEYFLSYDEGLRTTTLKSSLWFGKAVDAGLNTLLITKDLDKAKAIFESAFVNDPDVIYVEEDTDAELITQDEFDEAPGYFSMKKKGLVMLEGFNQEMMPRIKRVIAVQETTIIKNDQGDKIKILPDLIAEWEDGRIVLFDNKTSSMKYKEDSAEKSIQLSIYYTFLKEKYDITHVGFIVMRKGLKKNRVKICQDCSFDGTGGRHATCPNKRNNGRCDGQWNETIRPEAYIQLIINKPRQSFIDMVLSTLDEINFNIQHKVFYKNLNSCIRYGDKKCDYYDYCHNRSMVGLVKKEKK